MAEQPEMGCLHTIFRLFGHGFGERSEPAGAKHPQAWLVVIAKKARSHCGEGAKHPQAWLVVIAKKARSHCGEGAKHPQAWLVVIAEKARSHCGEGALHPQAWLAAIAKRARKTRIHFAPNVCSEDTV